MTKNNFKYLLLILFVNCANIVLCKAKPNYDSQALEDNTSTIPSTESSSSNSNYIINPVGGYGHPKHTIRYSEEQLNLPNDYLINSNSDAAENKQQYHQSAINVNGQHQNQDQNNNIDKYNVPILHTINNQNEQQQNNEQNYYGRDINEKNNIDNNYLPYYLNKNENISPSLSSYDQNVNSNYAVERKMYEDYARELLECMERHRDNLLNNIMAYRREYQQQLAQQYNEGYNQEYNQEYGRRNSPRFYDHQKHQQMYSNNNPFIEYQGNSNTRISDSTKYKQSHLPDYYNGFNMVPNDQNSFVQKQPNRQKLNDNYLNSYGY